MKRLFSLLMVFSLMIWAQPVWAISLFTPGKTVELPEAVGQAPVFLGTAVDPQTGRLVEGYAIYAFKGSPAKPDNPGGGNGNKGGGESAGLSCYGYLAKDAKWKSVEPWVMDPSNQDGMSEAEVFSLMQEGVDIWEDATDGDTSGNGGANVMGAGSVANIANLDTSSPNGDNEVVFGSIDGTSAIAVTIVWGVWGGPPPGRYIAEWDQIYDDEGFAWSTTGETGKMDFMNIAVHELGHSFGMADLYTAECTQETMYGYAGTGETNKRDLNAGDITGIDKLY
jgi:hypothetical protein